MNSIRKWRQRTKERLVAAFGGKCYICDYDKVCALEFHHINPNDKGFALSGVTKSWDKIVEEARKCTMVCSNCHKEIHSGLISVADYIKFNEDFADYERNIGNRGEFYNLYDECPICKSEKPVIRQYCSTKCRGISQQKVNWNKINLSELMSIYHSYERVGKKLNVSGNIIKKRMGH